MIHRVITNLQEELNSKRLDLDGYLYEMIISGSPDKAMETIVSQMNRTLDERDEILINAFTEITEAIQQNLTLVEQHGRTTHCTGECLPKNYR